MRKRIQPIFMRTLSSEGEAIEYTEVSIDNVCYLTA